MEKSLVVYKIVLNCDNCGRFVIIDRKYLVDNKVYHIGCEDCKNATILFSGVHFVGETVEYTRNGTKVKSTRKA